MKWLWVALVSCYGVQPALAQPCVASIQSRLACVSVEREADVIIDLTFDDHVDDPSPRVAALAIAVDGTPATDVLIFPGTGRRSYSAVVGPLAPGPHRVTLIKSAFWPAPAARLDRFSTRVVTESDSDFL